MILHRSKCDYIISKLSSDEFYTGPRMKQRMVRLDRIANEMNAWLLAIAIGLGMLDLTVLVAKCLPALPPTPVAAADHSPSPAPSSAAPAAPRS